MIYVEALTSPLGKLYVAVEQEAVIGLWLESQKYFAATILKEPHAEWQEKNCQDKVAAQTLLTAKAWLEAYFSGQQPDPAELLLKPKGSAFRQRVWQELLKIPYGKVTTYGAIARVIAEQQDLKTMSAQAVGGAVGHNPISIIIPCHRVMGSDGGLTGYAGGIEKKQWLLKHEGYWL